MCDFESSSVICSCVCRSMSTVECCDRLVPSVVRCLADDSVSCRVYPVVLAVIGCEDGSVVMVIESRM